MKRSAPAELLVVLVEQRSRMAGDVADGCAGELVGLVEPAHARARQDVRYGRAGVAREVGQPVRPVAVGDPRAEDGLDLLPGKRPWRATRSRAAIRQTRLALGAIAAEPVVAGHS